MPKKANESYQDYRERVINSISPSFCGAKWYNATIWLGSGTTASCHHPPAHKIPLDEVLANYRAIHNTIFKKSVRKEMMEGTRPQECEYCWKIEDLGPEKVSDRVYQSMRYTDDDLVAAYRDIGADKDSPLKTLEIAFDSNCNFACNYCNASFSTTWMSDIKTKGPYQNLISDGGGAFVQDGTWAQPYGIKNEGNPYVQAFMQWWDAELQHTLQELRVTGGEATMSQDFWKLIDWYEEHQECKVPLAVNSNLGTQPRLIQRLVDASHKMHKFRLFTSCEATGQAAEYIRDGLNWEEWKANVIKFAREGKLDMLTVMMTINALCLGTITDFMDEMIKIKEEFGHEYAMMSVNIQRFPSFQSVSTLPLSYREQKAKQLEDWLQKNWHEQPQTNKGRGVMHMLEFEGFSRLIAYLREVQQGHAAASSLATREHDFKVFYEQYDERRGKNFINTFPELAEWYQAIDPQAIKASLPPPRKIIPIIAK